MRWIRSSLGLILIYGTCIVSSTYWTGQWVRFRGVENWPAVDARIKDQGSVSIPYQYEYKDGHHRGAIDASFVTFDYTVAGRTYVSKLATPDGGGLPMNPFNTPWKAFYKPESPATAVLAPVPYQGTGWLLTALISAIFIAVHLFTAAPDLIDRYRWRKAARKGLAEADARE